MKRITSLCSHHNVLQRHSDGAPADEDAALGTAGLREELLGLCAQIHQSAISLAAHRSGEGDPR